MQKGENETQKGERLKSMTGRKKAKAQREREREEGWVTLNVEDK